jgi:predicted regulator of Ras-like GTPase activity (Roadblock/LC7/MglB family)
MSFESHLRQIVEQCGGGIGAALMGNDGIPIEQVLVAQPPDGPLREDIGTAGVEFGRILDEIRKASDALGGGGVAEAVFRLARLTLIFSRVEDDIVLIVAIAPDGNLGKARYLIRRQLLAIRQEL